MTPKNSQIKSADIKILHLVLFVLNTPERLEMHFVEFLDCSGLTLNDTAQLPAIRNSWAKHLRTNSFASVNFKSLMLATMLDWTARFPVNYRLLLKSRSVTYLPMLA